MSGFPPRGPAGEPEPQRRAGSGRPRRPATASRPGKRRGFEGTTPIFEDEFFRQLFGEPTKQAESPLEQLQRSVAPENGDAASGGPEDTTPTSLSEEFEQPGGEQPDGEQPPPRPPRRAAPATAPGPRRRRTPRERPAREARRQRQRPRRRRRVKPRRAAPKLIGIAALAAGALTTSAVYSLLQGGGQPPAPQSHATDVRPAPQQSSRTAAVPAGLSAATGNGNGTTELSLAWSEGARAAGKGQARLTTQWKQSGRVAISGKLYTAGAGRGGPIAVIAADADRPGGGTRVGELQADSDGNFATAVAVDRGAARKLITFSYRPEDGSDAVTASALLEVEGSISAVARSRNLHPGDVLALSGRTQPGAVAVQISARPPGSIAWREHATVQSSRSGAWETLISLPSGAPSGTYRFQARIEGDTRRGYLAAARTVTVRVR